MDAAYTSETSVTVRQIARNHVPDYGNLHRHRNANPQSYTRV